ncbi:hypothetical protein PR048_025830 [Dryococelus australis]|uniref:Uncharacterized protein n=1 Tax=Dryococelus australis TaxID=614101 RepID=A0ABQ9GJP2_9NEOP|nr:hypothetical protein PR048_025830 [Dryococelus australis]
MYLQGGQITFRSQGQSFFPEKVCAISWLENVEVAERASWNCFLQYFKVKHSWCLFCVIQWKTLALVEKICEIRGTAAL